MCVGRCSRIVGPCLLVLGMLSVVASILLLFPGGSWQYLVDGHISRRAKIMPGTWGGGHFLLPAGAAGSYPHHCCGMAFLSVVLSKLALLGSAACFFFSGLGLTDGPLCLYNTTESLENFYLFCPSTWGTCLEPVGIVAWHVTFFSLLLLISAAEMLLTFLQIINGCAGCLCGFCERKEAGLSRVPGVR
uniref:Transmembrane 4 L six family member 5 n=1 Tax=Phasianus colchicus TaxID=9054 RepID=A0A669PVE8_PHACC